MKSWVHYCQKYGSCFIYSVLAKLSCFTFALSLVQGATEWLRGDSVSRAGHVAVGAKVSMFVWQTRGRKSRRPSSWQPRENWLLDGDLCPGKCLPWTVLVSRYTPDPTLDTRISVAQSPSSSKCYPLPTWLAVCFVRLRLTAHALQPRVPTKRHDTPAPKIFCVLAGEFALSAARKVCMKY